MLYNMKGLAAAALAAGLLASSSAAIQLTERESPNVVGLDITRRAVENPVKRDALRRRQSKTVTETLTNEATLYYANVSIGTPAQELSLHIDTGSSDLWANVASSEICTFRGDPCSSAGTYNANSSSTYKYVNSDFSVSYVDGSGAAGDYATDAVSIGGQSITDLQFGIGYDSTTPQGILGIGYTADEAQVNTARLKSYANLPQAMANAGLIRSNAYSLWLNDLDASTGSILFGGVDTAKYTGQLQTIPIQKVFDQYAEFIITLTGVDLVNNGNNQSMTTDLPTAVILDSGSSLAYLPNDLTSAIYSAFEVEYDQSQELACAAVVLPTRTLRWTSPSLRPLSRSQSMSLSSTPMQDPPRMILQVPAIERTRITKTVVKMEATVDHNVSSASLPPKDRPLSWATHSFDPHTWSTT